MRVIVGAIAVLGLAVTVATGQPSKERAAALKAPEPLAPSDLPPVARGALDDFPSSLSSTPVPRSNSPAARTAASSGPAWLAGADPNVLPAAGSSKTGPVLPLTPPSKSAKDDSSVPPPPKMLDRIRGLPNDKPSAAAPPPQPGAQKPPAPQPQQQPQPTASTPFRGTGTNGAPVFAGPPAYRWYGWGSVTPGANPLAPAGQYPKASANWYSITGATPGAFPVPVSEPGRLAPGTEPPTYGLAPRRPGSAPVTSIAPQPPGQPYLPVAERPEAPKFTPPETKFIPGPSVGALPPPVSTPPSVPSMPVGVPTLTPIPKSAAAAPPVLPPSVPPASVAVGPLSLPAATTAPPAPVAPKSEPVAKPEPTAKSDPVAVLPPMPPVPTLPPASPGPSVAPAVPVSPAAPAEPVKAAATDVKAAPAADAKSNAVAPAPLPTSVTAEPPREEQKWQQSSEPATPRPGTWAPATEAKPLPTVPVEPLPSWQSGAAKPTGVVARAQMTDNTPDPIGALIKQVCQGRAEGVEIRWTGTKKVQVCFEIRGADAAKQLVSDISKRPELTAYQIDFCVVVK